MESKEFTEFPITLKISNDDMNSLLEKALDGGSLYWCYDSRSKYDQSTALSDISNGGALLLYGMDGSVNTLTKDKILLGIQRGLPYLNQVINGINLDVSSIDGDSADLIVQLALFGNVVFE